PAGHGAGRGQILGNSPPLAACAQDVQNGIEDLAQALRHWPGPRATAQKRSHQIPFGIRQVARVAQTWASVETSVLWGPHGRLRKSAPTSESQVIARIQLSLGQALMFVVGSPTEWSSHARCSPPNLRKRVISRR